MGEKQGVREAIVKLAKRLKGSGMSSEQAKKTATGAALRVNHSGSNEAVRSKR